MSTQPIQISSNLEKGPSLQEVYQVCDEVTVRDTVSWDGPSDPSNPLNWSTHRKWFATILTSMGGLVTLMSGAMLAPALEEIGEDLGISIEEASLALSIYVLAFAFGPMVLAPCSEVFGRRPVWIAGTAWYAVWNLVCGFAKTKELLIVARLMAGLGASAEFAVSGPIVTDMWSDEERGKSMAIRGFLPLLGPALGPIVGGLMVQHVHWRWLFWVLTIFDTLVLLMFIVALPETHHPTILSRKATAEQALDRPKLLPRLRVGIVRPTRLLCKEPIIQVMSFILAYQFGILYIMLSTFSRMWTEVYGTSSSASGLHYLAIVTGYLIASQIGGWAMDKVWAFLKKRHHGQTRPENRIPLMIPGTLLIPLGLLWYGWSAEKRLHWIMPDVGVAILGCGLISAGTAGQAYVIEAFLEYNASATAASQLVRSIFAFVFPIFAPELYDTLGYGWGNTVLAAVAAVLGLPTPFLLWKYGEMLRAKGRSDG